MSATDGEEFYCMSKSLTTIRDRPPNHAKRLCLYCTLPA